MGQFATPPDLARDVIQHAKELLPQREKFRFMDPAFGTGSFYSAAMGVFPPSRIGEAMGYEIDPAYAQAAKRLWKRTSLTVRQDDFTRAEPPKPEKRDHDRC
jgi:predicted RNA methylase